MTPAFSLAASFFNFGNSGFGGFPPTSPTRFGNPFVVQQQPQFSQAPPPAPGQPDLRQNFQSVRFPNGQVVTQNQQVIIADWATGPRFGHWRYP